MAAVTTVAIGAGLAAYQIANAESQKKKTRKELNNYERQTLNNAFEDIPISTEGIDYVRDENARATATLVDTLQGGDARTVVGGIPQVVAANNQLAGEAARYMENQYNRRNYAIAQDNARIEGITENRDISNINALSSQEQAAKQDLWNGINSLGSTVAYGARNLSANQPAARPAVESINAQPIGVQPISASSNQVGFSNPYSIPSANPYTGTDIYGGAFDYGDMINKYPY